MKRSERAAPPFGLMQDWPLTTDRFLEHARRWHPDREIVARQPDGSIARTNYAAAWAEARRISSALIARGIRPGDRVATLGLNGIEHFETWYGITGIGAVCHTVNPRLFAEQLAYIVNHAEDRLIFADACFAPLLAEVLPSCPTVEAVIWLTGETDTALPREALSFAAFIAGQDGDCVWGGFDERTAAGLCYTSGTTGNPKGVLYSHRSNFLHTMMTVQADVFAISVRDTLLAVVPMFHANAWAITFSAPATGAKLVLPGPMLGGASLFELIEQEQVTVAAGVPTIWLGLLDHMTRHGLRPTRLKRVVIGGAACPEKLLRGWIDHGIEPIHAWGMTEMSPVGTVGTPTPEIAALPLDEQVPWRVTQGRPALTVEMKLVGEAGEDLPHDGTTPGALRVRGPAVAAAYFRDDRPILDEQGFFDTGDIATIDPQGYMRITDRAKDVIKSGGEWISSIEVENAALLHPKAALAAVIGVPDHKWSERPRLFVQLKPGETATAEEFRAFLEGRIARWWIPDSVQFIDAMPIGGTGKVDKKQLRSMN